MAVPSEELRFAVVLNGGVSLAVWMGGAVRELHALTRPDSPYAAVAGLLGVSARADVIAGTSAGGINGAVLALAQANKNADVGILRDLWAEQGRMESLLQRPFRGSPPSLLRGDDYFLPKLHDAMRRLCEDFEASEVEAWPIDLTITTTLLRGAREVSMDAFGQRLPQTRHDGVFHFSRHAFDATTSAVGVPAARDDFDPTRNPDITAELALAARCTAGFPVAFEPSFVPARSRPLAEAGRVDAGDRPASPGPRPDLGGHASWRTAGPAAEVPADRSRFAVDGGLLANTPTRPALAAIDRLPAGPAVKRVMLLVYPHAPADVVDEPDTEASPPTLTATIGGLLGALSSQGDRTFVDEVEQHNREAASRRGTRADILRTVGDPASLESLAGSVFPHYRALRMRRAGRDLAARYVPPTDWSYERIRQAAEAAQRHWLGADDHGGFLPYVPAELPRGTGAPAQPADGWGWGITAALDVADIALDLLKRLVWVVPEGDRSNSGPAATVRSGRLAVHAARAAMHGARRLVDDRWSRGVLAGLAPDELYWRTRLAVYRDLMLAPNVGGGPSLSDATRALADATARRVPVDQAEVLRRDIRAALAVGEVDVSAGQRARNAVDEVVRAVDDASVALDVLSEQATSAADLGPWQVLFEALPERDTEERRRVLLDRLLWVHVAGWTMGDEVMSGNNYAVDLVQLSLRTTNPFAVYSTTPDDKVGGMSVNRFGGFLKTSWRMNDWTWGRLDAATALCQVLLTTERLRRRAVVLGQTATSPDDAEESARSFVDALAAVLYVEPGGLPEPVRLCRERAVRELTPVFQVDPPDGLPAQLPALASLAAWAIHLRIAIDELPAVARGVLADVNDGGNARSRGVLFREQNAVLLERLADRAPRLPAGEPLSGADVDLGMRALEAFDRAGIGREPLTEEGSSDQMIRTATTAAAVGVTVLDGERSGLGAVKPVTRTLRGLMLLPYWVVTGLASSGGIAGFFALLGLSLGAVALALSLFGVLGAWAGTLGAAALLTAFGYAALRTGTMLHGVVLLTPVVPLLAFSLQRAQDAGADPTGTFGVWTVAVVLALAMGLMILGSLPAPVDTPGHVLMRRSRSVVLVVAALLLLALTVVVLVLLWRRLADVVAAWHERPWIVLGGCVVLVLAGAVSARWAGRSFDLAEWDGVADPPAWRWRGVPHPAEVTATWSVVYGAAYLGALTVLVWWWRPEWSQSWAWTSLLLTCAVLGLVLVLAVPVLGPLAARRRVRRAVATESTASEDDVVRLLVARGLTYRFMVDIVAAGLRPR